ncbi:MAG: alpha/beta fold hydrolase [Ahrensia sp.]|nr:alpha/beta fold hydrolase [Ahrensia sp.]
MIGNLPLSVQRRAVFFIGGYDPKSADAFFARHDRETGRFEALWDVEVDQTAITKVTDDITRASYETRGDGWTCHTDLLFLTLDDVVLADFDKPFLTRLARYLRSFADYMISGTAFSFARHAWRFFGYFLYPFVMLLLAFLVSLGVGYMICRSGVSLYWLSAPVIFLAAFSAFVQLGGKRYHVLHLMDLWSFSSDFLHARRADMDEKLGRVAETIIAASNSDAYEEIVLVGHSTGGALMLDAAGRAFERSDGTARFSILTVGSTALKIGLHPAAGWFRKRLNEMLNSRSIAWFDYQCLTDIINFYRVDPAHLMGVESWEAVTVRAIRIREMVDKATYARMRGNFFRTHYQFVFGNTKPYHYDFPAICFGPHELGDRAKLARPIIKNELR